MHLRTTILALIALAATLSRVTAADVVDGIALVPSRATPYDHQMARITPVLVTRPAEGLSVSIDEVNAMMTRLRAIPYAYSPTWVTPECVQNSARADCKGKAVALYAQMKTAGARHLYLVIGVKDEDSTGTHTWLEWKKDGVAYILDPTFFAEAKRRSDFSSREYRPQYAYMGTAKYQMAMD